MITAATSTFRPVPPVTPSSPSTASARSSTTQVFTPTQAMVSSPWTTPGRMAPRRPNGARPSTIWFTPVRCPITLNSPNAAQPTRLPTATTTRVSSRLRPSVMPSAPSTQLIGARFAPVQIQNCSHGVESRWFAGIGWMPCASKGTASVCSAVITTLHGG